MTAVPSMLDLMTARALALIERHGTSPTGVARSMGRSHTWLHRKLQGDRPLHVADLDELLAHLGVPATVLLEPVLLPGDLELLGFLLRKDGETTAGAVCSVFADGARGLARLQAQGLISDDLSTTIAGDELIAACS